MQKICQHRNKVHLTIEADDTFHRLPETVVYSKANWGVSSHATQRC